MHYGSADFGVGVHHVASSGGGLIGGSAGHIGMTNSLGHVNSIGYVSSMNGGLIGHTGSAHSPNMGYGARTGYSTKSGSLARGGYRRDPLSYGLPTSEGISSALEFTAGENAVLSEITSVGEAVRNIQEGMHTLLTCQSQVMIHLQKSRPLDESQQKQSENRVSEGSENTPVSRTMAPVMNSEESKVRERVSFEKDAVARSLSQLPPGGLKPEVVSKKRSGRKGNSKEPSMTVQLMDPAAPSPATTRDLRFHAEPEVARWQSLHASSESLSHENSVVAPLLPSGWPDILEKRPVGEESISALDGAGASAAFTAQVGENGSRKSLDSLYKEPWHRRCYMALVMDPNSKAHMYHSLILLLVLISDVTVVPFLLAWEVEISRPVYAFQMFTICFWTLDIFVNLLTGVFEEGKVRKEPQAIFHAYSRSWMVPDVCLVLCDWISVVLFPMIASGSANEVIFVRLVRMGRFLRILGVFRVVKFVRMFEELLNRRISESIRMVMKLVTMVLMLLWINHLLCCIWFQLGLRAGSDTGLRWLDYRTDLNETPLLERATLNQYLITYHWAVAQVTLGSNDIYGTNSLERGFSCFCLIFGLLFGSTLVSSLSAAMVQFEMLRNGRVQKLQMVRRFLRDNEVDLEVSYLVQRQVKERLRGHEKLSDKDVPALALLSSSLLALLRLELYRPKLVSHPLFRLWASMDLSLMRRLCFCLEFAYLRTGDDLCAPGPARACAFLLLSGTMQYVQEPDTSPVTHVTTETVWPGQWLCEPSLWSVWLHVGTAFASGPAGGACRLLQVPLAAINEALKVRHTLRDIVMTYAAQYHKRLIAAKPPLARHPSDLRVPFTDYEDIVASMSAILQEAIGKDALRQLEKHFHWRAQSTSHQNLSQEVKAGKSLVMVDGSGEVMRVVAVMALRVQKADGMIFVQLGKYDNVQAKTSISCYLPGGKQDRGETSTDAAQRFLETRLTALKGAIEFDEVTRQVEWKQSKELGVRTKYLRTVCSANVVRDLGDMLDSCSLTLDATDEVEQTTLYLLPQDSTRQTLGLFTWLLPEDFDRLQLGGPEAQEWLQLRFKLLEEVDLTPFCTPLELARNDSDIKPAEDNCSSLNGSQLSFEAGQVPPPIWESDV